MTTTSPTTSTAPASSSWLLHPDAVFRLQRFHFFRLCGLDRDRAHNDKHDEDPGFRTVVTTSMEC